MKIAYSDAKSEGMITKVLLKQLSADFEEVTVSLTATSGALLQHSSQRFGSYSVFARDVVFENIKYTDTKMKCTATVNVGGVSKSPLVLDIEGENNLYNASATEWFLPIADGIRISSIKGILQKKKMGG